MIHRLARSNAWSISGIDHHSNSNDHATEPKRARAIGKTETTVQPTRLLRVILDVSLMINILIPYDVKAKSVPAAGEKL